MPPVMLVLDATFLLQSQGGKRSVAARKFFKGPFTTAMKPNELLTEIQLPAPPKGAGMGGAYASFEQAASGYALAGAAALIARSEEHTSELQSLAYLVCRLLLEKKKK